MQAQAKELKHQCDKGMISDEKILTHVFGPNKYSCLFCEGTGLTKFTLWPVQAQKSKIMVENVNCELKEMIKRAESAKIRME